MLLFPKSEKKLENKPKRIKLSTCKPVYGKGEINLVGINDVTHFYVKVLYLWLKVCVFAVDPGIVLQC